MKFIMTNSNTYYSSYQAKNCFKKSHLPSQFKPTGLNSGGHSSSITIGLSLDFQGRDGVRPCVKVISPRKAGLDEALHCVLSILIVEEGLGAPPVRCGELWVILQELLRLGMRLLHPAQVSKASGHMLSAFTDR
jgi:hypothetical protein